MNAVANAPGFFGKLPCNGDFLTRRLSRDFLDVWDGWLQEVISESKASLGEDTWLDAYLTAPIWCFALQPGICGERGWAGILMPSVDRVGRYFPLTIAAPLPDGMTPLHAAMFATGWFERALNLALTSLEQEDLALDPFDEAVESLGAVGKPVEFMDSSVTLRLEGVRGARIPLDAAGHVGALQRLVDGLVGRPLSPHALWWSSGSERVEPSLLWTRQLPTAQGFQGLITGTWDSDTWAHPVTTNLPKTPVSAETALP